MLIWSGGPTPAARLEQPARHDLRRPRDSPEVDLANAQILARVLLSSKEGRRRGAVL